MLSLIVIAHLPAIYKRMTHPRIPHRAVLRLDGPDTIELLERTVTHTVADWPAGEMRYGALLTPQGKIIADYLATRTDTGVLIDVHEAARADLEKRLKMFRLRADVVIEADDTLAVLADPAGASDPRSPFLPHRRIVPDNEATGLLEDYNLLRIEAGIPEWGEDYRSAEVFPTDINMDHLSGVDYKKGCFVGQEVASRMKRKAQIRKRTLRVAGDALVTGADILCGTVIGTVTSQQNGQGLALIRLDRLAAGALKGEPCTSGGYPVTILTEDDSWQTQEISEFYVDV